MKKRTREITVYVCDVCGKEFERKADCERHERLCGQPQTGRVYRWEENTLTGDAKLGRTVGIYLAEYKGILPELGKRYTLTLEDDQ